MLQWTTSTSSSSLKGTVLGLQPKFLSVGCVGATAVVASLANVSACSPSLSPILALTSMDTQHEVFYFTGSLSQDCSSAAFDVDTNAMQPGSYQPLILIEGTPLGMASSQVHGWSMQSECIPCKHACRHMLTVCATVLAQALGVYSIEAAAPMFSIVGGSVRFPSHSQNAEMKVATE